MSGWIVSKRFALWIGRRYVEMNMDSVVRLARPEGPAMDEDDRMVARPVPARLLYEGRARVYTMSGPQNNDTMEESQVFSSSYVTLPLDTVPQYNDLVEVLESPDDQIVGKVMRVLDVDGGGSLPVGRRCMVTAAQRFAGWTWVQEQP